MTVAGLISAMTIGLLMHSGGAIAATTTGAFYKVYSPQNCRARYESQERYILRSANAQIRNSRDRTLQVVCPLDISTDFDTNGACDSDVTLAVGVRLRPAVSSDPVRVRLSFADPFNSTIPGAFKADATLTVADANWDGTSVYTNTRVALATLNCLQKDTSNQDVLLDGGFINLGLVVIPGREWIPSAILYLPPGAMVRFVQFSGGED